jgi:phosphoadenosine phosphosulfate reductase
MKRGKGYAYRANLIEVSHMTLVQDIRSVSVHLDTPELLRYLIKEKFPGKIAVTASLIAPSVVVLKMVADIDPATPIIFCQRPPIFEVSAEYRTQIVERLGLTNVSLTEGHETRVRDGDHDHCERMWVHYPDMPGSSLQVLHINDSLAPYSCWISAVYHMQRPNEVVNRVDVDGLVIKVDPLVRWSKDDVRAFMRTNDLPYHKLAARKFQYDENSEVTYPTYHF